MTDETVNQPRPADITNSEGVAPPEELRLSKPVLPLSGMDKLRGVTREEFGPLYPRLRLLNLILFFCPIMSLCRVRLALYRLWGFDIAPGTTIYGTMTVWGGARPWKRLHIGPRSNISHAVLFDLGADITIGGSVAIAHHTSLITTSHESGDSARRCGDNIYQPIVIGDGAWIGAHVTILPGVTVGTGSIVGTGSVVSADVAPNTLVWGVPAKPIKRLI